MARLDERLRALERIEPEAGALPIVLPDDAPESELERLRAIGRKVYRWSDAPEQFV